MSAPIEPQPLTAQEEADRARLLQTAEAGRLEPGGFKRLGELNQRAAADPDRARVQS